MKKYLALFDLDGTLFDTGDVNYYAYKDALTPFGVDLEREYFVSRCNGRHYTEFLPQIMGNSANVEAVHKAKKDAYAANLNKARQNRHLFELIRSMKDIYHMAIVTTASKKNTIDVLKYFECEDLFDYIVTQEDVTKVKPDPQGFNLAIEYFGVRAEDTVIFEDSDVGIEAARMTGATVMTVNKF